MAVGLSLSPSVIARREAPWQSHSKALHVEIAQPVPSEAKESSSLLAMTVQQYVSMAVYLSRQDKLKGKTTFVARQRGKTDFV